MYNYLMDYYNNFFEKFGTTFIQFNVLRILRGQKGKPSTINDIRSRLMSNNSDASRLIDRMLLSGVVNREINPTDRRAMKVTITKKGMDLLDEIDKYDDLFYDNSVNSIDKAEAGLIADMFDKILEGKNA
jgi:DNA-binding MarR family transcriptional regulator